MKPLAAAMTGAKVGDTVEKIVRADPFRGLHRTAGLRGVILKIAPVRVRSGGVRAYVTVRWENGYVGRNEDRGLSLVARA